MIEIQNICIRYGDYEAIKNVSFILPEGQIIAVLGANGAGKTTLLKSLNGAVPLAKGTISLDEKPLELFSRREIARSISVVAQENETKFPVTVLEFVFSGRFAHGGVFGWESEEDLSIARNAIEMCDLKDFGNRLMNELSGGERQRVVFARALATEAKTLLLDEPTANLDLSHQAILFQLVRERCQSRNSSALIITHDLNLASEFADEILLLKRGEVIAKGQPGQVLKAEVLREVFEIEILVDGHPKSGKPRITMSY